MRDRTPETRTPEPKRPSRHGLWIAGLITLTVAAGVAARISHGPHGPGTDPTAPGAAVTRGGGVALSAHLDRRSVLRGSDGLVRVELAIDADERPAQDLPRTPTDLVVILDRSGSMQGQPLHFAKQAVRELVSQLGERDRFGLVTYASGGSVAIGLEPARGQARQRWEAIVLGITADGGTNLSSGLDLAHALVSGSHATGHAPRVILLSDGHANQGDYTPQALRTRAARAVSGEYVISSVGIGQGFDETVMSTVADAGTGNFYYLPDLRELAGVFADEFAAARERVARGLEVRIQPGDGVQLVDASGLPLEHASDGVRFRPGDLFAGQQRRIWLTLRAPTHALGDVALGDVSLRFSDDRGEARDLRLVGLPQLACVAGEDDYYASFDADVYKRGSASEGMGSLKQRVAELMKAGRQEEAVSQVDGYTSQLHLTQTRALGYVIAEDEAELQELRDQLAAPEAAAPAEQNRLGKALLEAGRDDRRVGSKRK